MITISVKIKELRKDIDEILDEYLQKIVKIIIQAIKNYPTGWDNYYKEIEDRPTGKLVLVTAITPTKAGEGKTTTTIGLHDGLRRIGVNSLAVLREPSMVEEADVLIMESTYGDRIHNKKEDKAEEGR